MEEFSRQFLSETVETLENLRLSLQDTEPTPDSLRREIFRTLHTVKGTAQTFGFSAASRLAHELESLLAAGENTRNLMLEGIALLLESLTENDFQIPEKFTEKLQAFVPNASSTANYPDANSNKIPNDIYSRLSNQEKKIIGAAMREGKHIALIEADFAAANFAAELINFRERLNLSGEIVATFPGAKLSNNGKIGFQFLTASAEIIQEPVSIKWSFSPPKPANDFSEILRRIVRHGEEIAAKLDKQIEIETQIDGVNLSPAELKIVFEGLLHLVRNAIDHGIERVGKLKIQAKNETGGWRFSVADDGRGIDLEQIKARAIEKNLIADGNKSETEIINLIFQPEFSTKSEVTEISGRGVGLDAVKYAVEKFGGQITVTTKKNTGTTFEIILPHKTIGTE